VTVALALRLEGLALGAAAAVLYFEQGYSWIAFVVLLLAPDLGMLGYLAGPRVGAATYDLLHFEAWPVLLGLVGVLADADVAVQLALIWLTHIGVDRALGYGLKYPTAFKDTHLQRV
jgi:Domain of unknown function (DUF4260)